MLTKINYKQGYLPAEVQKDTVYQNVKTCPTGNVRGSGSRTPGGKDHPVLRKYAHE